MDPARFEKLLVSADATLREAAEAIDAGAIEIALVVDSERRLLATVTDGDLRRALLGGADLSDGVEACSHADPIVAPLGTHASTLLALMADHGLEQIPLLEDGRVADVAFIRDLLTERSHDTPVILMAGGQGTRLRPLTDDRPKPMLPVGAEGRPLLETTLRQLAASGFQKVLLTLNYRGEMIQEAFGDGSELDLEIDYVEEDRPLGSAGALRLARQKLDRPFLVMNADLLTNVNLAALLTFHTREGNLVTAGVRQYQLRVPYGVVALDGTQVARLDEKPVVPFFVNAGMYAVEPAAVDLVGGGERGFHMTDIVNAALAGGHRVGAFPIREYWLDVGELSDYERAHDDHATYFSQS